MQFIHILFVYDDELKWDTQGYSLCFLANHLKLRLKLRLYLFWCKLGLRAHPLRKNYNRDFSSIRNVPVAHSYYSN